MLPSTGETVLAQGAKPSHTDTGTVLSSNDQDVAILFNKIGKQRLRVSMLKFAD